MRILSPMIEIHDGRPEITTECHEDATTGEGKFSSDNDDRYLSLVCLSFRYERYLIDRSSDRALDLKN